MTARRAGASISASVAGALIALLASAALALASVTASLSRTSTAGLSLSITAPQTINYLGFTAPTGYVVQNVAGPAGSECVGQQNGGRFACVFPSAKSIKITFSTKPCLPASAGPSKLNVGNTNTGYKTTTNLAAPVDGSCKGSGPGSGGGGASFGIAGVRVVRGPAVIVSVKVPQAGSALRATLAAKLNGSRSTPATIASKLLTKLPAGTTKVRLALNNRGRTALKRHRRLTVTLKVTLTPSSGKTAVATRTLQLRS